MIDILSEDEEIYFAIHEIAVLAFGRESETEFVENLRKTASFYGDLVH